jgi:predicted dehydrogenase
VVLPSIVKALVMGGDGIVTPGDRITMAVIGCGGRANDNMPAFLPQKDVRIVAVCDVDDSPAPRVPYRGVMHGEWRSISDYGGGQLEDWAGHHIDIANWGLDLDKTGPVTIEGTGRPNADGIYDVLVEYDFTCRYENGLKMRVSNRYRMVEINPVWSGKDIGIMFHGPKEWIHVSRGRLSSSNPEIIREKIGSKDIRLYKSTDHYRNFLDCIRTGKETVAPAEAGHRAISVAHLGEIAIRTGQKLHWDPIAEKFTDGNMYATRLLRKPYRDPWQFPG